FNGGCNLDPPLFSDINCGDTYCSTAAWDGSYRDTDWYEIVVTEYTKFTWTVEADFYVLIGLVEMIPPGAGDCSSITGFLDPYTTGGPCEEISITTDCLPPGTYWFFVAPDFGPIFDCNDYVATLTCVPCGACCIDSACSITTEADCISLGGDYVGDGTDCGEPAGNPTIYEADPSLPIPNDDPNGMSHTISVPDSFTLADVDVDVVIDHTWIWDLTIEVEHLGTTVTLWDQACNGEDNIDIIFDDEGNTVVCASPTVGNITPLSTFGEALSAFDGMDSAGDWTISIVDNYLYEDAGTLLHWSVHLDRPGFNPCAKRPVPHLKWSQPPIEWDPMSETPVYCGWDELSWEERNPIWYDCWNCQTQCHGDADCDGYVGDNDLTTLQMAWPPKPYSPCADFNHDLQVDTLDLVILQANWMTNPPADCPGRRTFWHLAADDFGCLGSMPITSIHWWGSHPGWEEPGSMPPDLPIAWRIG
ncbi:unnamed protein product, partial [marine sediment metagenome]